MFGAPQSYFIRVAHPTEWFDARFQQWKEVPAAKPWGRKQVIHIIEPLQIGQTRGVAEMVSVLKNMKMTKKFQDVTLQNAVVNASYAAAIESELPSEMLYRAIGAGGAGIGSAMSEYMTALASYVSGSENIHIDGVKLPHLFPGTKLNLKPMGTPGGVGTDFEQALLRHTASALGLSYEQFSKDYTKTNYSSARASMSETWKFMQSRKKTVADRMATMIFLLWLEEEINAGNVPLPPGKDASIFYDPVMREALANCTWIGASRGQIDEKKETESAIMRIDAGLSTYEIECARLGEDFRKIFAQRSREKKLMVKLGLDFKGPASGQAGSQQQQQPSDGQQARAMDARPGDEAVIEDDEL
jgi:lambda family phage portal protein